MLSFSDQQWEKMCWRLNEEVDKTPLLLSQRKMKNLRYKRKIKGCLHPPLLLLQHPRQAHSPRREDVYVCLKVCVRTVGGSSGPCSCSGDLSWSGWAGWARWSGATPRTEAPQCRRWTLRETWHRWNISQSGEEHPWLGKSDHTGENNSPIWMAGMESACWLHRGLISKSNFLSRSPVRLQDKFHKTASTWTKEQL